MKVRLPSPHAIAIGLWLFGALGAGANEWKSEELNCAITFPDGWNQVSLPESKVAVQNDNKTKTIFLIVQDVPRNATVNEAFILAARLAFTRRGGTILSESHPTIEQLPALEIVGRITRNGTDIFMKADTVIVNGKLYRLEAMDLRRNVLDDQEMNQCLASFRFVRPTASPQERSAAYRLGFAAGRYTAFGGAFIALVALAVSAIVRKASRREGKPPPLPPRAE